MKDLYKAIGLPNVTDNVGTIERAIATSARSPKVTHAARFILLNPARKAAYDRTHGVLRKVGQLRANLGLARSRLWMASDCADFDVPPSSPESELEALRARASQGVSEKSDSHPIAGIVVLGVVCFAAIYAFFYASDAGDGQPAAPGRSAIAEPQDRTEQIEGLVRSRLSRSGHEVNPQRVATMAHDVSVRNAEPLPETGVLTQSFTSGLAPLEIRTQVGSNYYVKVLDWTNNRLVLTAFIRGGEVLETTLPLGSYEIKYAAGKLWYGASLDFADTASYARCDERFDFTETVTGYSGFTIELIPRSGGNLKTDAIAPDDF